MIVTDLFKRVLVDPPKKKVDPSLYVVSGYASATFVRRHLVSSNNTKIHLVVGMQSKRADHYGYLQLFKDFPGRFVGHYIDMPPYVHSKVYSWFSKSTPVIGFSGSANYSQGGFLSEKSQINQMVEDDPSEIYEFYRDLLSRAVEIRTFKPKGAPQILQSGSVAAGQIRWIKFGKAVQISLLDGKGKVPGKSGLNWGHRLEKKTNRSTGEVSYKPRDPNEAYLSIKKEARIKGFLPKKKMTFTLLADDGVTLDASVAQSGRKAISTTYDNKILGKYIRKRLGLKEGAFITAEDLKNYGRTDFTIEKLDDETFRFDFSV